MIFPYGGGGGEVVFLEKCSLLVYRLGLTSECYIEVEQKAPPLPCFGYTSEFCAANFSNVLMTMRELIGLTEVLDERDFLTVRDDEIETIKLI